MHSDKIKYSIKHKLFMLSATVAVPFMIMVVYLIYALHSYSNAYDTIVSNMTVANRNSVFHRFPDNPAKRLGQQNQSCIYYSPDSSPLSCTRVHLYLPLSVSAAAVPPRHAAPCHSQTPYQNRTTDPVSPRVPPVI